MKNIKVVDNTTYEKAQIIFNKVCKFTDKYNNCISPYMYGNININNSNGVGIEIVCNNHIHEFVLCINNIAKKYLILGGILK